MQTCIREYRVEIVDIADMANAVSLEYDEGFRAGTLAGSLWVSADSLGDGEAENVRDLLAVIEGWGCAVEVRQRVEFSVFPYRVEAKVLGLSVCIDHPDHRCHFGLGFGCSDPVRLTPFDAIA